MLFHLHLLSDLYVASFMKETKSQTAPIRENVSRHADTLLRYDPASLSKIVSQVAMIGVNDARLASAALE